MELVTSWWGDGDPLHVTERSGRVDLRAIPNHDVLLKVFCDSGRHLVAVVRRDRAVVTVYGTAAIDRPDRTIGCRCKQNVEIIDPKRLAECIDPARSWSVRVSSVVKGGTASK